MKGDRMRGWPARSERWLFAPAPADRLAAVRIGLAGVLALRLATGPYLELAAQPAALYRPQPLSFMHLLPTMPPPGAVLVLQVVATALAILAAAGWRTRVTLPAAWLTALPLMGMTTSLGKVAHNDVLLLVCLLPLLPARSGDAWSLDARRRARAGQTAAPAPGGYGWPVRTATLVVIGAYFFAGLAKVLHAGPSWVLSDNLRWVLYVSSDAQAAPNAAALFVADRPWLAHLLAAGSLGLELAFPLVLWRRWLAWPLAGAAVAMHAGIWAAMGLNYWAQAATVVIVLIDWPALGRRLRGRRTTTSKSSTPKFSTPKSSTPKGTTPRGTTQTGGPAAVPDR